MERRIVSLGSTCTPKLMLGALGIVQPTLPFDWLLSASEEVVIKLLEGDEELRTAVGNIHAIGQIYKLGSDDPSLGVTPEITDTFNTLRDLRNQGRISVIQFRSALQALTTQNYKVRYKHESITNIHDYGLYGCWEEIPARYQRRFARLDDIWRQTEHELIFIRYKWWANPYDAALADWVSTLERPCKLITLRACKEVRWIMEGHNTITFEGPFQHTPDDSWILREAFERLGIPIPVTATSVPLGAHC